ncbi:uncharacterized protein [Misgurnus anguillicaudatus]|uniref:uncharacterized protein n=1 Tax=Misgurnus anguillicaudatus TaxID=75329 RepID=UPI003CCF8E00
MKTISLLFFISIFINSVFGDEVKSVSVMEGDSLTLHTDFTDTQADDVTIVWTFGPQKSTIAKINREPKGNQISIFDDVLDGRFRDRLQLNNQTGDLIITNIITQHTGLYQVQITVRSMIIQKRFNVNGVSNPESDQLKSVSVKDGDSVTLHTDVPDIKKYDEIQWKFKGIRIAHLNKSASKISEDDDIQDKRFKDKLQLDVQTGSLKIKNIRTDLSGLYEVEITSISSSYTIHQSFTVTVSGEVKTVSVMKGDPVTINTDVPDIKTYDRILLVFGCDDKRIADVNKQNEQFTLYGRIREGLMLNDQTGDLTIKNIRNEDGGLYELTMSSRRRSIQRRFSVSVSERGLSPGAVAGITVFFLLLAAAVAGGGAAGVIYYRRKITKAKHQLDEIQPLQVDERKSADLKTEVNDMERVDLIEWRFGETLIAEINPANNIFSTYDGDDDLFRDKLKLNPQTGDLNINDISEEHDGVYTLKIIRDGKTSYKRFNVSVRDEIKTLQVYDGESVNLKIDTHIQKDDVIEWRFGETLIAANKSPTTSNDDLFRDKLNLNHQTGDLNIKDIREEHTGVYKLKIIRDEKTSYKRFSVFVYDEIKTLEVDEGKFVDLKTEVKDIKRDDVIEWRFGETLIAEINPANNIFSTYDGDDDLFRDKLKLNHQTGDLNINDIREEHTGVYKLKIIRDEKTLYRSFSVSVRDEIKTLQVNEGESVNLKIDTDIQRVDLIEWRFGKTLIAANKSPTTSNDDLFKDKLKLNHQTGDLNIKDIREEHTGVYKLKIIRGGKTSYKRFSVFVRYKIKTLQVNEGESVDLKIDTDIQKDDVLEWTFGETLIAANKSPNTFNDDLFRDKLKLNHQTGDLNINDIREEHTGDYKLKIIRRGKTLYRSFSVFVRGE